ncbi:MAG: CDP-glucose 4,6-dehydratase [Negativicutes bacterium]|nr:CDP-glucose 4,6-dehydratase [Negativicutes bacterium]
MTTGFWRNKTVFLTGHTGFKGTWLALWLQKLGAKVIGYSLKAPTKPNMFDTVNLSEKMISVYGDVREHDNLYSVIKQYQPDIVFHLAAQSLVRKSYHNPIETFSTNIMGTVNILDAAKNVPSIKAVINITSDKCYENKEWVWGYRESDPMGGDDPYSCSKGCSELITASFRKSFFSQLNQAAVATARAGNVIGGGDWAEDRLVPDCIRALHSSKPIIIRNPHAFRPWQHVLEPLSGYINLAKALYDAGPDFIGAWNFGPQSDVSKSVGYIVQKLISNWGSDTELLTEPSNLKEANYLKLDCSKAETKLGWKTRWGLDIAICKTIEWYKAFYSCDDMYRLTIKQIDDYEQSCLVGRKEECTDK